MRVRCPQCGTHHFRLEKKCTSGLAKSLATSLKPQCQLQYPKWDFCPLLSVNHGSLLKASLNLCHRSGPGSAASLLFSLECVEAHSTFVVFLFFFSSSVSKPLPLLPPHLRLDVFQSPRWNSMASPLPRPLVSSRSSLWETGTGMSAEMWCLGGKSSFGFHLLPPPCYFSRSLFLSQSSCFSVSNYFVMAAKGRPFRKVISSWMSAETERDLIR